MAVAVSWVVELSGMVEGFAEAVKVRVCGTGAGCTVKLTEALRLRPPLQVAATVRVIVLLLVVVLAGAV